MYICNAFTLNMLQPDVEQPYEITAQAFTPERMKEWLASHSIELQSAIGHDATAQVASHQLEMYLPMNRMSITLAHWDKIIIVQLQGPRLPEGTILSLEQMSQFAIAYWLVSIE